MASSSISGLVSGLDTAGIIDQLMQLEAVSQNRLKSRQSIQKSVLAALQSLNTDVASLATKAADLAKPASWQSLKATASSTDLAVSVGSGAVASTLSVTVNRLATHSQLVFANSAGLTDVVAGSSVELTTGGTTYTLPTGGGTLKEVAAAINAKTPTTGVTAATVKVADGSYRLLTQSTSTGAASAFTLTDAGGGTLLGGASAVDGVDASITVSGIPVTSSTNTFTDLAPGVSLTLADTATPGKTTTVTIAQDTASTKANLKAFVDQVNAMLTSIDNQTAPGSSTAKAGLLKGDPNLRSLRDALLETVFGDGTSSLASVGVQTDRYGKLVFKEADFDKAYAADPAGTAARFTAAATPATDGWLARIAKVAKDASDPVDGTITAAITGRNRELDRLGKSITAWDDRLELRRTSLQRQYAALETALSGMQSQGSWLAGQIASLPKTSS